jgi:hypothetical protein
MFGRFGTWGLFFVHFFRGKFRGKFSPQKMLGKNGIFRGKSFEKWFFQEFPRKKMYERSAPGDDDGDGIVEDTFAEDERVQVDVDVKIVEDGQAGDCGGQSGNGN